MIVNLRAPSIKREREFTHVALFSRYSFTTSIIINYQEEKSIWLFLIGNHDLLPFYYNYLIICHKNAIFDQCILVSDRTINIKLKRNEILDHWLRYSLLFDTAIFAF